MNDRILAKPAPVRRQLATLTRRGWVRTVGRLRVGSRELPDFIIVGAQRCGTTSLWRWLGDHPSVLGPALGIKGVHYFDLRYRHDLSWYQAHFPSVAARERVRAATGGVSAGEASPYYLFHPEVPSRIAADLPTTKFIVLLRNPIDRALSHYHHMRIEGQESVTTFEEALAKEAERLEGAPAVIAQPSDRHEGHMHHSYLARGHYAAQLQRWFDAVGRERMLVLGSRDLFENPATNLQRITEFLGIPDFVETPAGKAHNAGEYDDLASTTRIVLQEHFKEPNARLFELLGERLW